MNLNSLTEILLLNTVRIEVPVEDPNGTIIDYSFGTGFFFEFENKIPVLITNKHVINHNKNQKIYIYLHSDTKEKPIDKSYRIEITPTWIFHPNKDLCCCFMAPVFSKFQEEKNTKLQYAAITEQYLADHSKLSTLRALEEIVMVGYPRSLWDKNNNFPIFRKGYTASHPLYDYYDDTLEKAGESKYGLGLVDLPCFDGSSGSPIFILNENGYTNKFGKTFLGAKRIILLGILFSSPVHDAEGELIINNEPIQDSKVFTKTELDLGYYIKSSEINILKAIALNKQ